MRYLTQIIAAVLLVATFAFAQVARAQDAFHQWALEMLESDFSITGGTFLLGSNEAAKIGASAWIYDAVNPGESSAETIEVDPSEDLPFTRFNRYTHPIVTNEWYDALVRVEDVAPVQTGDVALLVVFLRGESLGGGVPSVEVLFDMNTAPYDRALSEEVLLQPEWNLVVIPFEMPFSLDAGGGNFGLNFGRKSVVVDMAAPIVMNYGDKYTVEALQALIDTGGQIPLLASFTTSITRGAPPLEVQFDATNSTAPGSITNYAWDFGDGATGGGVTTSHTYTDFGTFTVELTVTDDRGASHAATRTVIVFDGRGLPESPLRIPYASTAPEIDGDVDAIWNDAVSVTLDNVVADFPPVNAADFHVTAYALWNSERLFVRYDVRDADKFNNSEQTWQDDSVELYVDGGNEKASSYDENDGQYELGWNSDQITGTAVDQGKADGVEFVSVDTNDGYRIEVSVPWSSLNVTVASGDLIGIDFMANDDDTGPVRQTKLSWFNLQDNAWSRLDGAGTAQLVGGEGAVTLARIDAPSGEVLSFVPVTFSAARSVAPAAITSYAWDFGDGNTGEGVSASHMYRSTGSFIVTLTITDADGNTDSASRSVTVIDGVGRPDKPLQIPRASSAPIIDAIRDAVWDSDANTLTLGTVATGEALTGPDDLSATTYIMWDSDAIYVFVDVTDDVTISNESADTWRDDAVEVFFDGDNSKTQSAYDANDGQFTVGLGDTELTGMKGRPEMSDGVLFASAETEKGYAVEMSVPWASLQREPAVGVEIGFEVQINDDDTGGDRDSKITWYDASDNAWQWAHVFATAVLVETVNLADEDRSTLPDGFAIESIYPNPFNPTTNAVLNLRDAGSYELRVYNVLGQQVQRHLVQAHAPGRMQVSLDLSDRASGVYFITLENRATGASVVSRAMLVK